MKCNSLELKYSNSNAVIKIFGMGEVGESAINYMMSNTNNLKSGDSYSIIGTDLLFLISDITERHSLNELLRMAKVGKNLNTLTIALITSEQDSAIEELQENVDAFIPMLGIPDTSFNEFVLETVQNILHPIIQRGIINFDFSDLKEFTTSAGRYFTASGSATGDNRAHQAIEEALSPVSLKHINFQKIDYLLVHISSDDINMIEFDTVGNKLTELLSSEATLKIFVSLNDSSGDKFKVFLLCKEEDSKPIFYVGKKQI